MAAWAIRWPIVPRSRDRIPLTTIFICSAYLHVQVPHWWYCPGGNGQSIGSVVYEAIVCAVCGQLLLCGAHWATSAALLKVVDS